MKNIKNVDIVKSIKDIDFGCCYVGEYKKDKIIFDDDEKGNGVGPFLILKIFKNKVKVINGFKLKKNERKEFEYKLYDNIDRLTDDIGEFTRKYFKSFILTRK